MDVPLAKLLLPNILGRVEADKCVSGMGGVSELHLRRR